MIADGLLHFPLRQLIPRIKRYSKMELRCNIACMSTYHPCPMHELEVRVAFSSSWISEVVVRIIEGRIGDIYVSLVRCSSYKFIRNRS